ncbi:MAG TPA: DUF3488 and transglutaminase-like domain-containing protein [Candidatus Binatia bacterium]|nr:DUF3488 and transglutaminase-like domain-containing protein [Candidatus Binatia bacterium]
MTPLNPSQEPISLTQAIGKYFELAIYLLVITGFATLASTGALDLPTLLLVGAALTLRGYFLARQRRIVISQRWTTPLTLSYFVFYGADFFLISRSFLAATVHLVLFAVVIRTFSLRRDRDYTTLAILAFLLVLASAVLTVDSVFLFFFAVFMLIAVAVFLLMEMKRSAKDAAFQARHSRDPQEHRHLAFSLARMAFGLAVMILAGAGAMFFLLPRMSAGYLGSYSFGTDFSTGFSDHVQLGRIGQIQQSGAVVMHIHIDGDSTGRYPLHWRGVALQNFDGANWSNPREARQQYPLPREADGFAVPLFTQGLSASWPRTPQARRLGEIIHYRVMMEPIGTNVFFLAPWARHVGGIYRGMETDWDGAVTNRDPFRPVTTYEADSDIAPMPAAWLRNAGDSLPAYALPYLELPTPLDPRISQLAAQITSSAGNNYDRAAALERHLRGHYAYTLQLPRGPVADPLANFLFERKQGHCEYFASSMAVMLRTLHIPSRVVTGFTSNEFNDITGNYVVRARDAHAWVEAYFPGYGWVTFDPTPGSSSGSPQGWERAMLYLDAASSFWREWVISYDSSHQYVLGRTVLSGTRSSWEQMRWWAQLRYAQMLSWAERKQAGIGNSPRNWLAWSFALVLLLGLLLNARTIVRALRLRHLAAHPEASPQKAASLWYEKMARLLARRGMKKSGRQTAQEFLRTIHEETLRSSVGRFTAAYEAARFGNSTAEAEKLPELYGEIKYAGKK